MYKPLACGALCLSVGRKEVVKLDAFAIEVLATVLGNVDSHFIIKAIENRKPHRKGAGKHMRQG